MLKIRTVLRLALIASFIIVSPGEFIATPERLLSMLAGALCSFTPSPFEHLRGWMTRPSPSILKVVVMIGTFVGVFAVGKAAVVVIDPRNTAFFRLVLDLEYFIVVYGLTLAADIVDDRPRRKRRLSQLLKLPSFKPAFRPASLQPHE